MMPTHAFATAAHVLSTCLCGCSAPAHLLRGSPPSLLARSSGISERLDAARASSAAVFDAIRETSLPDMLGYSSGGAPCRKQGPLGR